MTQVHYLPSNFNLVFNQSTTFTNNPTCITPTTTSPTFATIGSNPTIMIIETNLITIIVATSTLGYLGMIFHQRPIFEIASCNSWQPPSHHAYCQKLSRIIVILLYNIHYVIWNLISKEILLFAFHYGIKIV